MALSEAIFVGVDSVCPVPLGRILLFAVSWRLKISECNKNVTKRYKNLKETAKKANLDAIALHSGAIGTMII